MRCACDGSTKLRLLSTDRRVPRPMAESAGYSAGNGRICPVPLAHRPVLGGVPLPRRSWLSRHFRLCRQGTKDRGILGLRLDTGNKVVWTGRISTIEGLYRSGSRTFGYSGGVPGEPACLPPGRLRGVVVGECRPGTRANRFHGLRARSCGRECRRRCVLPRLPRWHGNHLVRPPGVEAVRQRQASTATHRAQGKPCALCVS